MWNVVVRSKDGNLADLEVASAAVATPKQSPLAQSVLEALVELQVDQVDFEVVSVEVLVASTADGKEVGMEEVVVAFKIAAMEADEEALVSKALHAMVDLVALTGMRLPSMLLLDLVVHALVGMAAAAASIKEDMVAQALQIATVPAARHQLVGLILEVAAAHTMTEMVAIVEAVVEAMGIVIPPVVEVVAIWSR
jgi:hypothetical protein